MATYYTPYYRGGSSPVSDGDWRYYFTTSISQNTQSLQSIITIRHYIQFKNQPSSAYGRNWVSGNSLDGGSYSRSNDYSYTPPAGNSERLIYTQTRTITHNSNGEKTITLRFRGGYVDYTPITDYIYEYTSTQTIKLPTINRTSSITSNATSSTEFGNTINFSITRYNSNFTHDISYSMYSANGTIATGVATSQSWEIPTSLIASTPDNANPVITITCVTKNGSTTIGTTQYTFNCKVPTSYVPTCSLAIEDIGSVPSGWNLWVKGKSILKGTITAEGSESSTIKSYSSTANDSVYNTNPFETLYLKYDGERTITSTVTDSRGRIATDSEEIEVVNYFSPTIIMCKVDRCLSDGTLNPEGTYGKATIQFKISPVNNLNAKTIKVNYGSAEISETATNYEDTVIFSTLLYGLETNATYNFVFSVIDSFDTVPQPYSLPPAFTTQSLLAGGKGVTFGQIATEEGLVSHFDNKFYKDTWAESLSVCGLKTECYDTNNWIVYGEDE